MICVKENREQKFQIINFKFCFWFLALASEIWYTLSSTPFLAPGTLFPCIK